MHTEWKPQWRVLDSCGGLIVLVSLSPVMSTENWQKNQTCVLRMFVSTLWKLRKRLYFLQPSGSVKPFCGAAVVKVTDGVCKLLEHIVSWKHSKLLPPNFFHIFDMHLQKQICNNNSHFVADSPKNVSNRFSHQYGWLI